MNKINLENKNIFITGTSGFIGSYLAKRVLTGVEGVKAIGLYDMNDYYDVRLIDLEQHPNYTFLKVILQIEN